MFVLESLYSQRFLLVHVGEHEADVGGEQVVHLVSQRGLEGELGEGGGVPDGEAEGGWGAGPVHDVGEREGGEYFLRQRNSFYLANN